MIDGIGFEAQVLRSSEEPPFLFPCPVLELLFRRKIYFMGGGKRLFSEIPFSPAPPQQQSTDGSSNTYVRTTRVMLGYCTTKKEVRRGNEKEVLG